MDGWGGGRCSRVVKMGKNPAPPRAPRARGGEEGEKKGGVEEAQLRWGVFFHEIINPFFPKYIQFRPDPGPPPLFSPMFFVTKIQNTQPGS